MSEIVTRFAPSPTGFLHIGNARTALFSYMHAKKNGGKFLLRVEDTDKKRSTNEAIEVIINGLKWLGLNCDGEPIYQSKNEQRHREIAEQLLAEGKAYKCYSTKEELEALREEAQKEGGVYKYPRIWRDKSESDAPLDAEYAIRVKSPIEGEQDISDAVQGEISYPSEELDDFVILRADGSPTYMLAVIVDDYDMGVTDIIRGDDHLTNSFKQKVLYDLLGWEMPKVGHVPLIHGPDGAKMSKRHGALSVEGYRDLGYLPAAVVNYLMGLGWNWGDEETIDFDEALKRFDVTKIGRSPSRFDFEKLKNINNLYLRNLSAGELFEKVAPFLNDKKINDNIKKALLALLPALAERSSTLIELAENVEFIFNRVEYTEKAEKMLEKGKENLPAFTQKLESLSDWSIEEISSAIKAFGEENDLKAGQYMPAVRAGVCGTMEAPSLDLVISSLGKEEVIKRLNNL